MKLERHLVQEKQTISFESSSLNAADLGWNLKPGSLEVERSKWNSRVKWQSVTKVADSLSNHWRQNCHRNILSLFEKAASLNPLVAARLSGYLQAWRLFWQISVRCVLSLTPNLCSSQIAIFHSLWKSLPFQTAGSLRSEQNLAEDNFQYRNCLS